MEEYEIRQSYGQKLKSKLVLQRWSIAEISDDNNYSNEYKFRIEVQVYNDGDVTESNYKVNVYFNNFNKHLRISWPQNNHHYDYTKFDNNRIKISANSVSPIFPNETNNAIRLELFASKANIVEALKDINIEIVLFYLNGEDTMETNLKDLLNDILAQNN